MKITPEQIEAALRYANLIGNSHDICLMTIACPDGENLADMCMKILAAAYREAIAEIERLQGKLSAENLIAAIDERGEKPSCDF